MKLAFALDCDCRFRTLSLFLLGFLLAGTSAGWGQESQEKVAVQYPLDLDLAADGTVVVVDLNLPGLWRVPVEGGEPQLVYRGSKRLREKMNRPRCCTVLDDGTILVGDSATREVYRIRGDGQGEPQGLTSGGIGIPNSLAVGTDGTLFVADLETRFVLRLPVAGGEPEVFSKTSVRGLHFAENGGLFAVTPTSQPLVTLSDKGEPTGVVRERVFEFPHDVVALEDGSALVSDGYAKAIWRVDAERGTVEKWLSGTPLMNPVGLALGDGFVCIADPHAKQVFRVDLVTREIKELLSP